MYLLDNMKFLDTHLWLKLHLYTAGIVDFIAQPTAAKKDHQLANISSMPGPTGKLIQKVKTVSESGLEGLQ